jgi:hypothetical protein
LKKEEFKQMLLKVPQTWNIVFRQPISSAKVRVGAITDGPIFKRNHTKIEVYSPIYKLIKKQPRN